MLDRPATPRTRLSTDRLALLTKIARMYHEQGVRQPEIATRLSMSQSRVSRFLKEAAQLGIVRTVVVAPTGVHTDLEDELRQRYGLTDVVVADYDGDAESTLLLALGAAGAAYLETTLTGSDRIGISSWSATLLATAEAMRPSTISTATDVVQVLGGVGDPRVQVNATRLTDQFARVTGGAPKFLAAPGIVQSRAVRDALMEDPFIAELTREWDALTVLLAGIGSLSPSPLLRESGNAVPDAELAALRTAGAVGDICLRFFDAWGTLITTPLNERVVGIGSDQLRKVPRVIGIAGGDRKVDAIRAAAAGGWIDVLITDLGTARKIIERDAPHS
ncbi:sugar-binding transcriptional regulator [Microlunatus parietis]|uniref:DNA-binding transcriptional regulator LsrR (DeoR family) n=1 Tax=Microlunatus parietis TaxID=682979 RepID=A0A7Y9IAF5_9ACTN|nr:sugar-binding transcriptional regulator [Microlunatus parietis]NYE72754.1 DNA-binding transcriptional regulator LsrR (DeoR family) [Microlunatus parietis]